MARASGRSNPSARKALRDAGRAAGGALIFSLPMLMTMEMWWLGFTMDRLRLAALVLTTLPLLMGLSRRIGFEQTRGWHDDALDSLLACAIAALVSLIVLTLFGVIGPGMSSEEIIGKIVLQSVPAAIGALLARSQFAATDGDEAEEPAAPKEDASPGGESYGGELFLMAVGALFLGFNVAPTEEMVLISYQMSGWHAVAMVLVSLVLMHGFVFAVGFAGGSEVADDAPRWSAFIRLTLPGYAIAVAISLYVLWIFGRTDGVSVEQIVMAVVVLALPSAIGAAAARLIL